MKITSLSINNFQGVRGINLALRQPINLFAGANGAGKSSIVDALRLAMCGDAVRVGLKKELGQLVSDGARTSTIEIGLDGTHKASIILPSGKTSTDGYMFPPALRHVLDAQYFAHQSGDVRRAFLFDLMRLSASGEAFKSRLLAKKLDAKKIEAIMPLLRSSADAGQKAAAGYAREQKAVWRSLTGEAWGSEKAEGWCAVKPQFDDAQLEKAFADQAQIEIALSSANQEFGAMDAARRTAAANAQRLAQLQSKVDHRARIAKKLEVDLAEFQKWEVAVEETRVKAGHKPAIAAPALTCPCCQKYVRLVNGELVEYNPAPAPEYDIEAAAKLADYERALALSKSAVDNDKRDLADADSAAAAIAGLKSSQGATPSTEDFEALQSKIAALNAKRKAVAESLATLQDAQRKVATADKLTVDARAAHDSILAWLAIADQLAPEGIQAEMLVEAIKPINERLALSAVDASWPVVTINENMQIIVGARAYNLLSESEKWRADAMIAEAVSFLSGVKLVVLDRFDVLDLPGRADLVAWLDILAQQGEIDTALVFGTLKALPANLPPTIAAHWVQAGAIQEFKVAA